MLARFAVVLVGAGLLVVSCGESRALCSATNCSGCCDAMGACRPGIEAGACGVRGSTCVACGLGVSCFAGACTGGLGAGAAGGGFVVGGGSSTGGGAAMGGGVTGCNAATCPGCCSSSGQCVQGVSASACGSQGASCLACQAGHVCAPSGLGGACINGSGGGSATGGGSPTSGGSAGSCSAQTCAAGCCSNGTCVPPTTPRCGTNGAVCAACPPGGTCESGVCTPCNGCVDTSTGLCLAGTSSTQCGRSGAFCSNCTVNGQSCQAGLCQSGPPTCTAASCPGGCCSSQGQCLSAGSQTTQACGTGTSGALCQACSGTCANNSCSGGFPGVDGGLPSLDGGLPGLGRTCSTGSQCAPGECCYSLAGLGGVCATIGNTNLLGGTTCGRSQMACGSSCQAPFTCNASLGLCR